MPTVYDAPQIVGNASVVKNMSALLLFPGAFQALGYVHAAIDILRSPAIRLAGV